MNRFIKLLIGLCLVPVCWAVTRTFLYLLRQVQPDALGQIPSSTWGLLVGFGLWLTLYFLSPRPIRSYVLAHELTHALWGVCMGARVKDIQVTKEGGHVQLDKTNFLVTLAPYFFPFYTMIVIAIRALTSLFVDMGEYEVFWLGAIGLTWGFHVTFTISTLMKHQPDIKAHGKIFSYAVIYLMNIGGLALWVVLATRVDMMTLMHQFTADLLMVKEQGLHAVAWIWGKGRSFIQ